MNDINNFKKTLKEIEHEYLIITLIMIFKKIDYSSYMIINQTLKETNDLLNRESNYLNNIDYNIIDNNLFEIENIINDLKKSLSNDIQGSAYLFLFNKKNAELKALNDFLLNILDDITIDVFLNDLKRYENKIIYDYLQTLIHYNLLNNQEIQQLNYLNDLINQELNNNNRQLIYKTINSLNKSISLNKYNNEYLNNKYLLWELSYLYNLME